MQARLAEQLFGEPAASETIGRFELGELLGTGAMGVVYAARDPELDRRVAIKLLRELPGHASDPSGVRTLQREAKAMARLRHPNVVQVHEVGTHQGQTFVAMELIAGCSLRDWMAESKDWAAVVDVFIEAGRGLAAAHSAGLVHRDFKPDNVLIETSGRVFVSDFGLARPLAPADPRMPESIEELAEDRVYESLTQTGTCAGTPAYMAPEALAGAPLEARADQFSFCVSFYEALYGVRPFEGRTLTELTWAKARGQVVAPDPARSAKVPAWLRRIVMRGLAPTPERRFHSIEALLDAIRRARRRRRRLGLGLAAGGLVTTLGFAIGYGWPEPEPLLCQHAEAAVTEVWNPARRDGIAAAFAASELRYADNLAAQAERELERYTAQWVAMRRSACEATHVYGEQSTRILDLRMRCLDRRLDQLDALLGRLEQPTSEDIRGSLFAIAALTPISACGRPELLESSAPLPDDPSTREAVAGVRLQLDLVQAGMDTGAHDQVVDQAREAVAEAERVGYKPVLAEAQLALGSILSRTGQPQQAAPLIEQAVVNAQASGHDEVAARAMIAAVHVIGFQLRDLESGARYLRHARAMLERLGDPPQLTVMLLRNAGTFEFARGNYEYAEDDFRESIVLYAELSGPNHFTVAESRSNLAAVVRRQGRTEEALDLYREAVRAMRDSLGPMHPNLFSVLNNMGAAYMTSEHPREAEQSFREAIWLAKQVLPRDHASVGHAYNNLGELVLGLGRYREAIDNYTEAEAIWLRALGPEHPLVAHPLVGRGLARLELGDPDSARTDLARGLEIRVAANAAPALLADAEFGLARAIEHEPETQARSLALARQALEHLDHLDHGDSDLTRRADVVAWLDAH